eukprot:1025033-Pyramimonas_sp.AAC.1
MSLAARSTPGAGAPFSSPLRIAHSRLADLARGSARSPQRSRRYRGRRGAAQAPARPRPSPRSP